DPDYPVGRINYMLSDSNAKLIITDKSEEDFIDIFEILNSDDSTENPGNRISPDNLAYVIYTSGSSGKPKGVMVTHKNIIRLISNQVFTAFKEEDRILVTGSISFDISSYEIWAPIINGVPMILTCKENILDNKKLGGILQENNITVLHLIPQLFNQLAQQDISIFGNLRFFLIGGDLVKADRVCKIKEMYPHIRIFHMYGPTENTTFSTCFEVEKDYDKLPIGKPLSNSSVHILNNDNQLLPVGVEGEICVGGDGVFKGYLNEIQSTRRKCINNPVLGSGRIYKTGDLGRWNKDGNLEFLGRIDNQVKIRGFRIELGEVENILLRYGNIDSAVVLTTENNYGEKDLVSYYVSEEELELSGLRSYLGKYLPDYMVPSYFVYMKEFPLTPNGKVDNRALPKPDTNIKSGGEYVAPDTILQKKLAGIWSEVLGNGKIGIRDNFFELGGHSLKATRVVSRISKELELEVVLKDIFENSTIEKLSLLLERRNKKIFQEIDVIPIEETYAVSNAQRRLWILDQLENSVAYNMPGALFLEGEFDNSAFKKAYSFIIGRHESLRTVFVRENGEPRQKILNNPESQINIIDLRGSHDKGGKAEELIEQNRMVPFNLENGPLVRFSIIRMEDGKYLLLFNMHHIISDGWSMNIFINELLLSYNSFKDNGIPNLPPLGIQYKDYSAWQNNLLDSSEIEGEREYWLNKLSGEIPLLNLPADNVRPSVQSYNGNSIGFSLSKDLTTSLGNLCIKNNASMFMMLQALVKTLFHRYTGEDDIILGSPIAGRVHESLENQIGFYINTLVFRDSINSSSSFNEFLSMVKETCTNAFSNQNYPFDRLVEELDIKRDLSHSPLFDVMLVLQNNESSEIDFDGLDASPYEMENRISKFDMTFNFSEREEGLFCSIEYNTDIYSEDRIGRMSGHLEKLISSVIENPESRIKDLQIIPESEKNLLLNVFNDTRADYPKEKTIVDLFEEQVEKTPDNIAVVFESVELSYRTLNEKANKVAHYLRNKYDIKPDDLVGIMLDRSEKMIIALLGILKSGAAYVPIDPDYPVGRINYMLSDSNAKLIITDKSEEDFIDIFEILNSDDSTENP
ncbi:MAG: amino acid adenylation domain-containing protein, partial [Desulfobacteraceae bacterium]|nr:amino acid adenylation domain-containing protein [Desulfobacteraceae bacterium]